MVPSRLVMRLAGDSEDVPQIARSHAIRVAGKGQQPRLRVELRIGREAPKAHQLRDKTTLQALAA
eukprot:15446909-Alexandrium_andersonii.AAC.1